MNLIDQLYWFGEKKGWSEYVLLLTYLWSLTMDQEKTETVPKALPFILAHPTPAGPWQRGRDRRGANWASKLLAKQN